MEVENWDAAWVFVKFRRPGVPGYLHATLDPASARHTVPSGAKCDVGLSDDPSTTLGAGRRRGMGVFVYRAAPGSGPNDWKGVSLCWLTGADDVMDPGAVDIKVFAIQMVYVPQCAFWLGDGAPADEAQFSAGDTKEPFRVTGEGALTLGGADRKNLGSRNSVGARFNDDFTSSVTQSLPATFPKGYAAFYCMRQEITQGQYADFMNTLTYEQQEFVNSGVHGCAGTKPNSAPGAVVGTVAFGNSYRNTVKISVSGVQYPPARQVARTDGVLASLSQPGVPAVVVADTPHVAYGMCYSHQTSLTPCVLFSAWAGLRPMTELEYEKACRGPLKPVPGELAWGTAHIAGSNLPNPPFDGYALRNAGQADEAVVWEGANAPDAERGNAAWGGTTMKGADGCHALNPINGPLRGGIFATTASDRVAAGASYWGVLEMTGNLWEEVVSPGHLIAAWGVTRERGRRFRGTHGDGSLNLPVGWEDRVQRGGSYDNAGAVSVSWRGGFGGGTSSMRGVRTAP